MAYSPQKWSSPATSPAAQNSQPMGCAGEAQTGAVVATAFKWVEASWDNAALELSGPTVMRRRVRGTRCGPASTLVRCLLASLEKLGQDIRPVSHDAVHPVAKQAAHVGFGVDGPDVDPKPLPVRCPDEPRRHYSQPVVGFGSLQRLVAGPGRSAKAKTAEEVEGD